MAKSVNAVALELQKLANQATEKTLNYNSKEANTARTWQKMMSDTAHQREVEDLKKAGLNPILSSGGSGAQSYTTSSASAQAENAANAVGGLYQAKMGADATRAAAAQNAAAMKAAAAQQAAAARYAAAMQYQASVYHSNKAYEASKYKADMDYKIKMDQPQTNPFGLADKYLTKAGISGGIVSSVKNIGKKFSTSMFETPKNGNSITKNNFVLDKQGIILANQGLDKLNIVNTKANRSIFVKATVFGDTYSMKQLQALTKAANTKKNSASYRVLNNWKSSI